MPRGLAAWRVRRRETSIYISPESGSPTAFDFVASGA